MTSYEEIEQANAQIKKTPIKDKDYVEVNQRIKAFRMVYPEGTIVTEMLSNENGVCIFKATARVTYFDIENGQMTKVLGTGHAYEKEGSTFINKTSYIENCETSAIGRALGAAGFGIDASVASAEEVKNAIKQQEELEEKDKAERERLMKKINSKQAKELEQAIIAKGEEVDSILEKFKREKLTDFNNAEFEILMKKMKGDK